MNMALPAPLRIKELISESFGPYPEGLLLKSVPNMTVLYDVYMETNGRATGLDSTEYVGEAPQNAPSVDVYGRIVIEQRTWESFLSEIGKRVLEADLRHRDQVENNVEDSRLTLESIFGKPPASGFTISVWVKLELAKINGAAFLTVENYEESLILKSTYSTKDRICYRSWVVGSLDVETCSRSRNYLERWRLYRFIQTLVENNPDTPVSARDPNWIVERMIASARETDIFRRTIFDVDEDSDVNEAGCTQTPRRPRHFRKSEAYGILSAHAEWFLAQQLATYRRHHHLINLKLLYKYCKESAKWTSAKRKSLATKKPWRKWAWGEEYTTPADREARRRRRKEEARQRRLANNGEDSDEDDYILDLSRFGTVKDGWEKRIENMLKKSTKPPKTPQRGHRIAVRRVGSSESDQDSDEMMADEEFPVYGHGESKYDSDLSDESSPPATDSDSDSIPSPILNDFPTFCLEPIELRHGRYDWDCPGPDCDYRIDLLNIPPSTAKQYKFPRSYQSIDDRDLYLAFRRMVQDHYREHARQNGADFREVQQRDGSFKIEITRWPPYEDVEDEERDYTPVKAEYEA